MFFFDIDGTLAIKGKIPESNLEALKRLKEMGYLTFICTGRAPFYAKGLFKDLISGYVACNGRYIIYNDEKIFGKVLTKQEIESYQTKVNQLDCGAMFVSDEYSCTYNLNRQQINEVKQEYGNERIKEGYSFDNYYTFDLFYPTLEKRDQLISLFKDDLVINDHGGHGSCDCSTIGFDKGDGIKYLMDHFKICKENVYAFGDGYNDLAMFKNAGHGIAMGNAVAILKEKATYITDDILNDGIINALKHENIL